MPLLYCEVSNGLYPRKALKYRQSLVTGNPQAPSGRVKDAK
jgi:hypothetical protein